MSAVIELKKTEDSKPMSAVIELKKTEDPKTMATVAESKATVSAYVPDSVKAFISGIYGSITYSKTEQILIINDATFGIPMTNSGKWKQNSMTELLKITDEELDKNLPVCNGISFVMSSDCAIIGRICWCTMATAREYISKSKELALDTSTTEGLAEYLNMISWCLSGIKMYLYGLSKKNQKTIPDNEIVIEIGSSISKSHGIGEQSMQLRIDAFKKMGAKVFFQIVSDNGRNDYYLNMVRNPIMMDAAIPWLGGLEYKRMSVRVFEL